MDSDEKEYLQFVCGFQKVPKEEIRSRIELVTNLVDIRDSNNRIKNLSSGNQMKVSIAAALIHNPRMLMLDEPFMNLDIDTQESLKALLLQLHEKKTMFITSHNLDILVDICDNFLIMDNGTIIAEIQKTDHSNIDDLKEKIRQKLSKRKHKLNLQWLQ